MNNHSVKAICAAGAALLAGAACASTSVYTNTPCVYQLVSNSVSAYATLLGPSATVSGNLAIPAYVKSASFPVTAIAPGAFRQCGGLTALTLDASSAVRTIGEGAFWGCTNLSSVTLRASVAEVGPSAFLGCSSLSSINFAEATGVTAVAEQAFSGCVSLGDVTLPAALSSIGQSAFRGCSALTAVALPAGVTEVADSAFQGCCALVSVTMPGVTALGVNAFADSGLTAVTLPAALTNIAQGVFANCSALVSVAYEGAPTSLGSGAFKNCASLGQLPVTDSMAKIAATAFDGCSGLTEVSLPGGIGDLSENVFENCTSLARVTCGALSSLGGYAFAGCSSLTNVTFAGDAPDALGSAFAGSEAVFVYYYGGTAGWKNLLAYRPTVMLGSDGSVATYSFAAWAVRKGLADAGALDADALEALFEADSASAPGQVNGAVYAFGDNLTEADSFSLLHIRLEADGTPVVETPALVEGADAFVSMAVEAKGDLLDDLWDLAVEHYPLEDATRAGYTPSTVDGTIPAAAFFRLRLSLVE